ncbi:2,4-dienoyl-CoA reductase [Sphingopyxis sp. H038]|jgi:citronellol/citronellal dehydrogenase|uniref:SDR family oxidoreductase n=1 Tax=unclassified Sphingopyxis TaxID=2614943 RepID=UPI0007311AFC|nr:MULTISPECIES: SDR family oxidoreductase [unclassified Sphingopyxis]KTE04389.1 2,4-dienoyl-CoA reductase [Sphingopyxis sp. H012]KTE08111.1 2,4-dienoyl-CoA reductase [Sphingopyxis sp. H093]KTE13410.1 2,4-dienoyl-CoA reductase [Sphingopyxis sp. H053]KTE31250.1 2,4-dienoyl-CoA reductase [Sphingopyxis sp. H080]KTE36879.1 2,4-dienoyl-CoA reductase [Sphingopyxis sp. H038]
MSYDSIFRAGLFDGQVIIVTGGGSGIGRCIAHELAALGAHVVIMGRKAEKLAAVEAEIRSEGGKVSSQICDIRDEEGVATAIEAVLADQGRIDGLVNNAGGQFYSPLKDISTKGFEAVVRNNLTGGFNMMREVYNRWMAANGGAIVNMIVDMWMGLPNFAHSGAARAGMYSLTQSAAAEWAASGVRVNSLAAGMIMSSGFDNYTGDAVDFIRQSAGNIPMQRVGTVSEVSAAISFLLSPGAAFITGTCLRVDGGGPNARRHLKLEPHGNSPRFQGFHLDSTPDLFRAS